MGQMHPWNKAHDQITANGLMILLTVNLLLIREAKHKALSKTVPLDESLIVDDILFVSGTQGCNEHDRITVNGLTKGRSTF